MLYRMAPKSINNNHCWMAIMQKKETKSSWKQIPMIMLLIMTIMKKGNKEPLETKLFFKIEPHKDSIELIFLPRRAKQYLKFLMSILIFS